MDAPTCLASRWLAYNGIVLSAFVRSTDTRTFRYSRAGAATEDFQTLLVGSLFDNVTRQRSASVTFPSSTSEFKLRGVEERRERKAPSSRKYDYPWARMYSGSPFPLTFRTH